MIDHRLQRFYVIVLIAVASLISLRIHGIQITPLLANVSIAGIAELRDRSKIRSVLFANIAKACQIENIALASLGVRVESV